MHYDYKMRISACANTYADRYFKNKDIAVIEFDPDDKLDNANVLALVAMFSGSADVYFAENTMHVNIWAKPGHADFNEEFYQWCVTNNHDMRQVTGAFDKWHAIAYKLQDYPLIDDHYYDFESE